MITEEQRLARLDVIGSSDVAILMGLSQYKTPLELYLEKKRLLTIEEKEEPEFLYWGNRHEPTLRSEFALRNGVVVTEPKEALEHPFYPFLRVNLDGLIPEWNAVWEGKTANEFSKDQWGEAGTDLIPTPYLLQVATNCAVTNLDHAYISVLIGGNKYREYVYKRDRELEDKILDAVCEFWDCIQNSRMPEPSNISDLGLLYPTATIGKSKIITEDLHMSLMDFKAINAEIKKFEAKAEKIKFDLMNYLEDAECLVDEGNKVLASYKTNKKGSRSFLIKGK